MFDEEGGGYAIERRGGAACVPYDKEGGGCRAIGVGGRLLQREEFDCLRVYALLHVLLLPSVFIWILNTARRMKQWVTRCRASGE